MGELIPFVPLAPSARDIEYGTLVKVQPGDYAPVWSPPTGWACDCCTSQVIPGRTCAPCTAHSMARCGEPTTRRGQACKRWVPGGRACHQHGGKDG